MTPRGLHPTIPEHASPLDVRGAMRRLWRSRVVVALLGIVFAVAAVAASMLIEKVYSASSTISVAQPQSAKLLGDRLDSTTLATRNVAVAEVLSSPAFGANMGARMNHRVQLRARALRDSDLLILTARGPDAALVKLDLVEAVREYNEATQAFLVEEYKRYRASLSRAVESIDAELAGEAVTATRADLLELRREAMLQQIIRFDVASVAATAERIATVSEPAVPKRPVSPDPVRNGIAGGLLGLVAAATLSLRHARLGRGAAAHTGARVAMREVRDDGARYALPTADDEPAVVFVEADPHEVIQLSPAGTRP